MKLRKLGNNQTVITMQDGDFGKSILFSYDTPVAALINGRVYKTSKKWSVTTSRHINQWLSDLEADKVEEKDQSFFDNLVAA
jgi:hypothetical protein